MENVPLPLVWPMSPWCVTSSSAPPPPFILQLSWLWNPPILTTEVCCKGGSGLWRTVRRGSLKRETTEGEKKHQSSPTISYSRYKTLGWGRGVTDPPQSHHGSGEQPQRDFLYKRKAARRSRITWGVLQKPLWLSGNYYESSFFHLRLPFVPANQESQGKIGMVRKKEALEAEMLSFKSVRIRVWSLL